MSCNSNDIFSWYTSAVIVFNNITLLLFFYFFYLFRVDNVDQASQAKAEIEQKQRNEAEIRKERNDVWTPRVNKIYNN